MCLFAKVTSFLTTVGNFADRALKTLSNVYLGKTSGLSGVYVCVLKCVCVCDIRNKKRVSPFLNNTQER